MTLFTVFDYIYENYDRSFAFYKSCRIGKCCGCFVEVGGKNKLTCCTHIATRAKAKVYNREGVAALENHSLLRVMEIAAQASLVRQENRGCHVLFAL